MGHARDALRAVKDLYPQTTFDDSDLESVYRQGSGCVRATTWRGTTNSGIAKIGPRLRFWPKDDLVDILGTEWNQALDSQRAEGE